MAFHVLTQEPKLKLVPWSSGTDEEIAAMINAYYAGDLSYSDISSVWTVGDVRRISIGAIPTTDSAGNYNVQESHEPQTLSFAILGWQTHELTTPSDYWSNYDPDNPNMQYSLMAIGALEVMGAFYTDKENKIGTATYGTINDIDSVSGGWGACGRRKWCNYGFYNALPTTLKNAIKNVNVKYRNYADNPSTRSVSDKVFLPAVNEINNSGTGADSYEGSQLAYYATAANRVKYPITQINGSRQYWTRSIYSSSNWYATYGTSMQRIAANNAVAIAPMFCV